MKTNWQYTSLELSKNLKEIGLVQGHSERYHNVINETTIRTMVFKDIAAKEHYAAYSMSELMVLAGQHTVYVVWEEYGYRWLSLHDNDESTDYFNTPSECLGTWILNAYKDHPELIEKANSRLINTNQELDANR